VIEEARTVGAALTVTAKEPLMVGVATEVATTLIEASSVRALAGVRTPFSSMVAAVVAAPAASVTLQVTFCLAPLGVTAAV
jgi:hypothetical protein